MVVIDSGNTICKIWIGEKKIHQQYYEEVRANVKEELLKKLQKPVLYSTVAPKKFDVILKKLQKIGFKSFINIGEFVKNEKPLGSEIEGMGVDRMLGMIGAATFLKPPLITVDCGTAVTVNLLKEKKRSLGGAIFAGYSTQMRSLALGTEGITGKERGEFKGAIGKTTETALQSGIIHSISGGVEQLKRNFLKESNLEKVELVVTGGDGEIVYQKLMKENISCVFREDLIKLGIQEVYKTMEEEEKEKYTQTINY